MVYPPPPSVASCDTTHSRRVLLRTRHHSRLRRMPPRDGDGWTFFRQSVVAFIAVYAIASTANIDRGDIRYRGCAMFVAGYQEYQAAIPNGANVSRNGVMWPSVGHAVRLASTENGTRNDFGRAFLQAGRVWTRALCAMDTDGDGFTNGEELGDPNCQWTPSSGGAGVVGWRTSLITHPAFADSFPPSSVKVTSVTTPSPTPSPSATIDWPASAMTSSCNHSSRSALCNPGVQRCCSLYDAWRVKQDPTSRRPNSDLPLPPNNVAYASPWCCPVTQACGETVANTCSSLTGAPSGGPAPPPAEDPNNDMVILIIVSIVVIVLVIVVIGVCLCRFKVQQRAQEQEEAEREGQRTETGARHNRKIRYEVDEMGQIRMQIVDAQPPPVGRDLSTTTAASAHPAVAPSGASTTTVPTKAPNHLPTARAHSPRRPPPIDIPASQSPGAITGTVLQPTESPPDASPNVDGLVCATVYASSHHSVGQSSVGPTSVGASAHFDTLPKSVTGVTVSASSMSMANPSSSTNAPPTHNSAASPPLSSSTKAVAPHARDVDDGEWTLDDDNGGVPAPNRDALPPGSAAPTRASPRDRPLPVLRDTIPSNANEPDDEMWTLNSEEAE